MAEVSAPPSSPRTIVLRGSRGGTQRLEGRVATAKSITPGMLIEKTTSGDYPYGAYQPHSTQGGYAEKLIAEELGMVADIPGATFSGGTVDDAYAAGDLVFIHNCIEGDEVHAFLKASGTVTALTSFLQSAGNGDLEVATSTNVRLFKALEVVTPGSSRTRCRVRAL